MDKITQRKISSWMDSIWSQRPWIDKDAVRIGSSQDHIADPIPQVCLPSAHALESSVQWNSKTSQNFVKFFVEHT